MTFLHPMILWALALPLLLAAFALWRHFRAAEDWHRLIAPAHAATLVVRTPLWRRALPLTLALLALVGGILAAARPINGYTTTEAMATGRNLLIALDISRSMETQDVKPSRLEEARAAAFELVDALPGDKIGLIVFSGEADLVVPLTYDHTALRDALEQVNRSWAGYGGTNFGLVLRKAMQDFERSAPTGTNALVIFSDGEDTVGSTLDIAKEAREKKLLVITVGVGTSIGDSIPDARGENGLYQDAAGKHVISKLNTESLRRFAEATGGDFFTMGSGADLSTFAREAVQNLDMHEESFSDHKVPRDLFAPFAITSLLLLFASMVLGTEWRPSRGAAAGLLLLLMLGASPVQAAPGEESLRSYKEALSQMAEDEDKAREAFSRALLDEDGQMQAACLYELGNMGAQATLERLRGLYGHGEAVEGGVDEAAPTQAATPTPEQLEEIVSALQQNLVPYRDALGISPGLKPAQSNIAKIEELIKRLKEEIERLKQQQQQQDQQNQDEQQDNQQQDQQNQDNQQQDGQQDKQGEQNQQNPNEQPKDGEQEQQSQRDRQDQQDEPNKQQDGKDKRQDEPNEQQDGKDEQPGEQQQQGKQPHQPAPRPQAARQKPMSDKEKAEQRAASILQMHLDEEKGSPIPHFNDTVRPPEKDY